MTRVAIYARHSSDNQREAPIEDQVKICRERVDRERVALIIRVNQLEASRTLNATFFSIKSSLK